MKLWPEVSDIGEMEKLRGDFRASYVGLSFATCSHEGWGKGRRCLYA